MNISTFSLNNLSLYIESLVKEISLPICVALWGNMGVGKTTFAKNLIRNLLQDSAASIPSPTFNLIQIYQSSFGEIWHCDLYRLKHTDEIIELGLLEALNNYTCIIEWPERLEHFLPSKRIDIFIKIIDDHNRSYEVISLL